MWIQFLTDGLALPKRKLAIWFGLLVSWTTWAKFASNSVENVCLNPKYEQLDIQKSRGKKKKKKAHCVTNPILLGYPAHFTINPGLEREKAIQLVWCSALSLNQTLLLLQQCWNFLLQRLTMLLSIHHYYFNIALERKWNCHMVELSCQTSVTTLLWEKKPNHFSLFTDEASW